MTSSQEAETSAAAGAELLDCSRYGELDDVASILKSGADANHRDAHGNTALHVACANGHADVVRALIQSGAKHTPNNAGNRPLQWAVQNKHVDCVRALLDLYPETSQMNVLDKNGFGKSALTDAFKSGDADLVKMVLLHKSAEEDMLLSQSTLGKGNKQTQGDKKTVSAPESTGKVPHAGGDKDSDNADAINRQAGAEGGSPSVTHELGFGVGTEGQDDEGVTFRIRELPIRNPDECFGEDAREDTTGLNLWGAAVVLARWLSEPSMQWRLAGKTVLELGAGCGAGGISAAVHGRPRSVLISDLNSETMANLAHNVALNRDRFHADSEVRAITVDWGDESTWEQAAPPVDFVIAADIVYQANETSPLLHAIHSLLKPGGTFFHVAPDTERDGLEGFLEKLGAAEEGDGRSSGNETFELISGISAPDVYSSNPLLSGSEEAYMLHFSELPRSTFRLHEFRKRA